MKMEEKTKMNHLTPREAIKLFGGSEGRQILDYVTKKGFASYEYLVGDNWLPYPTGQVRGVRYNLETTLSDVNCIANIWRYIKDRSIQTPEKPDKILEQLAIAKLTSKNLRLFSPWGPRYNRDSPRIERNDPEIATLKEIRTIFDRFEENGYKIDYLLMPADTYGTEVNGLSKEFVSDYFKWLEEWAYQELGNVEVKPWSVIRDEQRKRYDELSSEINQNFSDWIKEGEYRNAVKVARVFNPERAEQSARKYCIERLVEGIIISEVYDPIKLSLVRKEKDSLDGPLKRIYIIQNRAPWLRRE
jgi:hypothetical protein